MLIVRRGFLEGHIFFFHLEAFLTGHSSQGMMFMRQQSLTKQFTYYITKMTTITKRDLVIKLSNDTGLTQQEVFSVVQGALDSITEELAKGNSVVMRNFGAFQVKEVKGKIGRNPKDPSKDVPIPPRAVVKFKPGKEMKEKVAPILPVIQQA